MPKCYQLVGVSASGKSTWIQNQTWIQNFSVVSTDYWVEVFARELGKTYSEVFDKFMPAAVSAMAAQVEMARDADRDIIWDQTSVTVNSRKKKFQMLPKYYHVAIVFKTPDLPELNARLSNRPGKTIPWKIVSNMIDNFQMPTEQEGFKEIWYVN